jgi:tartrate-resistant acid phosphatase type 5
MKYQLIFYSIGDWGATSASVNAAKYVAISMANYYPYLNPLPNFVISLGDNFYENGVTGISDELWDSAWFSVFIKPFPSLQTISWLSVLGNHDYYAGMNGAKSQIEMTNYSKNWVMPANDYYSYDKHTSSYHIFIDTIKIYPELYDKTKGFYTQTDSEHTLAILENMLIHAKKLNSRWIFVYGHYHLFSNGHYGNYNTMIQRILPLLKNTRW